MQRRSHGDVVRRLTAWAMFVCAASASCQELNENRPGPQRLIAARSASAESAIKLGNAYLTGHGVSKDEKQAAYWFEKAAGAGDPWAQQQIGFFYQAGIGVAVDPARAAHWYQLAAANGLVTAKRNLGVAYLWGAGVPMNKEFAAQLFRDAASHGDGPAATYLGNMYYSGEGVTQDRTQSEHWYTVGAKLHDPMAYYNLGKLLSSEKDHPHDLVKASQWLRMSVAGGYVPAIHTLALLLADHPEFSRSDKEALALFEEGSRYGQWRSSEALGVLHRDGRLTSRDPKAAYYYFQLAVLQGGEPLEKQLQADMQLLSAELGAEETAKAAGAAQAWYQEHHETLEFLLDKSNKRMPSGLAIVAPVEGIHAGQLTTVPPS
jgi:TPR repeat protein